MFGFIRPVRGLALQACLYLSLGIGAEILVVRQTAETVNEIQLLHTYRDSSSQNILEWIRGTDPEASTLRGRISCLVGFALAAAAMSYLREMTNSKLSMNMVYYIREAVYDRLQHAGFTFHDTYSTGELINRSLTDLQNVRSFIQSALLTSLEIVLIVGGYLALLLTRSPWVAALALLPLPIWLFYIRRFSRRIQPLLHAALEASDRNVSLITENIAGVHVVKAFGTQEQEFRKYNEHCDHFLFSVLARIRMFANFTPVIRTIATASHLTLFLTAGVLIVWGKMRAGDVLMLGSAMGAILGRLQQVSGINDQYQNAIVSAGRLHEIMSTVPTVTSSVNGLLPTGPGAVTFDSVTFGYDPEKPVLHDVSFSIPGGSIVAIVGPTGTGKTTLVNLLARFYDPQKGRIELDGVDLRRISIPDLRREIALVFQETYLFSDTVGANVAYGHPDAEEMTIEAASRIAQAHDFVANLPRSYKTLLGERGSTLSGGQRQRLAIARAILSDPRILILDDATAAVDPETEELIHSGTCLTRKGRTTFIIAHRVSTVQRADLVIVLEGGAVTQMGTHQELMIEEGHYRDIALAQLHADESNLDDDQEPPLRIDRIAQRDR